MNFTLVVRLQTIRTHFSRSTLAFIAGIHMLVRNYTAEEVMRYRDEKECSIFEAKGHFEKRFFLDMIAEARTNGDLNILIDIVEELVKKESFR